MVCKITEKLVREHLMQHVKKNNFLVNNQYGFIPKRSTTIQLLAVLEKWTEALDTNSDIDCIYMDYQKAFDKVPHKRLLGKLETYGIKKPVLGWIESFLVGRMTNVTENRQASKWMEVTSGVPQGSVLGPGGHSPRKRTGM